MQTPPKLDDRINSMLKSIEQEEIDEIERRYPYPPGNIEEEVRDEISVLYAFPSSMYAVDLVLTKQEEQRYIDIVKDNIIESRSRFGQTKGNLHLLEDMKPFVQRVRQAVHKIIETHIWWNIDDFRINQMWGNSYNKGYWIPRHTHPNNHLSGIFYLDLEEDSGGTVFFNPNPVVNHIEIPSKGRGSSFGFTKTLISQGRRHRLIIFPSYLDHCSEPNRSDKPRITISFNITAVEPIGNKIDLTYVGP